MKSNYPKAIPETMLYASDYLGVNLKQLERVDTKIKSLIEQGEHKFIAASALRRGQLIFDGQYGTSGMGENEIPLPHDAIYPLASLTKPVTATCIMILQERGDINLNDPVRKWFPEFEGEGKEGICLWHLLCHSSGLDEEFTEAWMNEWVQKELGYPLPSWDDSVKRRAAGLTLRPKLGLSEVPENASDDEKWAAYNEAEDMLWFKSPLKSPVNTAFSYNGMHYELIKRLVERITGGTMEDFARENIFEPLGMNDTHWRLPKEKYDRRVMKDPSHKGGEGQNSEGTAQSTSAGGGLKSTIADMLLFGQMFLQNGTLNGVRVLSPATVELMTKDMNAHIPPSFWLGKMLGSNWGLGWHVKNGKKDDAGMLRSERTFDHGGYGGARLLIDPDAELVVMYYMCEKGEDSVYDNMSNVNDTLYAALDLI